MLTADILRAQLRYDPESGNFFQAKSHAGNDPDAPAGSKNDKGYIIISVSGVSYSAHRLAWLYVHGKWPESAIDHENQVKHDNRINNLRLTSNGNNKGNSRLSKNSTTGAKGVYREKGRQGYCARIKVNKKHQLLGRFGSVDEAAHAYNKAAIKHFGEFACLNPIGADK